MLKKQKRAIVWTAYSRLKKRVIAYHIGAGKSAAKEIHRKVKKLRPNISHILVIPTVVMTLLLLN